MARPLLVQPARIGSLALPNRVVMTTVKLGYAGKDGQVTDRHLAFYVRRAQGRAGLLTTEPMYVQPNGKEIPTQLGIYDDSFLPGLERLSAVVHQAGGRIMAHINHAGRAANPKLVSPENLVSASAVPCPANKAVPRPLEKKEIQGLVEAFAAAAERVKKAGFDALEIPFSHGYLVHQFLSPHTNKRNDEYGGDFENRFRFGREILQAVRDRVGPDFPLVVRMNAEDHFEGGMTLDDALRLALRLEEAGADALSVSSGTMCETPPFCLYPIGTPKAHLLPAAAEIRKIVSIPVITAGRIRTPRVAEEALREGQTDLVGLGRAFLADPDWVRKVEEGDEEAVLLCAACHQGCLFELRKARGTSCMFNPLTGKEGEIRIEKTGAPKRVLVAGGGPGGMEAALVAAWRGHQVTLFEKENRLGGQVLLAAKVPTKEEFADFVKWQALMMERAGVEVRLGVEVTADLVAEMDPQAVVLATGGRPRIPDLPGLEETRWTTAYDILAGKSRVSTRTAFVVGGGTVGLEAAEFLARQGVEVTAVKRKPELAASMDPLPAAVFLKRLQKEGVQVLTGYAITRFQTDQEGNTTVFARPWPEREGEPERAFPAETVVIALGLEPENRLAQEIQGRPGVFVVGDAREPREILDAVWEGFEAGLKI